MRSWARRTRELHGELAAIAELDRSWWLLAGSVAAVEPWAPSWVYLHCDAEPDADTLMGYRAPAPRDPVSAATALARAARTALRELDGELPDQPLAVTITRTPRGSTEITPSALDVAAFPVGHRCLVAKLDDPTLERQLAAVVGGGEPAPWYGAPPFVCVAIGDEPLDTARHGHRRAWTSRGGPWLGLTRAADLAIVSTCHLVVDGYGHARITARIADLARAIETSSNGHAKRSLASVPGAVPLGIAWRELPFPSPRVIPLAYKLGQILHRNAGRRDARFSPTFQIPVACSTPDDPQRRRHRVVAATLSLRFDAGTPEPFAAFEARIRDVFAREAAANGLVSRLLAAARAAPVPLAWKRKSISAKRPRWLEAFADVIGGRALLSRIAVDTPTPPLCAVASPSRLATATDPIGGCVITVIDDGTHAAITACGSGMAGTTDRANALIDELLQP